MVDAPVVAPPALDNAALTAALTQQAAALAQLTALLQQQQQQQAPPVAVPREPVLDLFLSDGIFDISTRSGSSAFETASKPLDVKWNGDSDSFPAFLVALQLRSSEVGWNRFAPVTADNPDPTPTASNIITIGNLNLFIDYHEVTMDQVLTAKTNRTDPRAGQNSKSLYMCLKSSLFGPIRELIFDQAQNLPSQDGPELFLKLTEYTVASSLVLSMDASDRLTNYDPAVRKFQIAQINSDLMHLFVLARSRYRQISDPEKVQIAIKVYSKIHQPESWATWVRSQIADFEKGHILSSTVFMNQAVFQQKKIERAEDGFFFTNLTPKNELVAMIAAAVRKPKLPDQPAPNGSEQRTDTAPPTSTPPFLRQTHEGTVPFKHGDTKTWKAKTYHFCECPTHRDNLKWHAHKAEDCKTRSKWLAEGGSTSGSAGGSPPASAHTADDTPPATPAITAMLASVLAGLSGNPEAQAFVAEAINALE